MSRANIAVCRSISRASRRPRGRRIGSGPVRCRPAPTRVPTPMEATSLRRRPDRPGRAAPCDRSRNRECVAEISRARHASRVAVVNFADWMQREGLNDSAQFLPRLDAALEAIVGDALALRPRADPPVARGHTGPDLEPSRPIGGRWGVTPSPRPTAPSTPTACASLEVTPARCHQACSWISGPRVRRFERIRHDVYLLAPRPGHDRRRRHGRARSHFVAMRSEISRERTGPERRTYPTAQGGGGRSGTRWGALGRVSQNSQGGDRGFGISHALPTCQPAPATGSRLCYAPAERSRPRSPSAGRHRCARRPAPRSRLPWDTGSCARLTLSVLPKVVVRPNVVGSGLSHRPSRWLGDDSKVASGPILRCPSDLEAEVDTTVSLLATAVQTVFRRERAIRGQASSYWSRRRGRVG